MLSFTNLTVSHPNWLGEESWSESLGSKLIAAGTNARFITAKVRALCGIDTIDNAAHVVHREIHTRQIREEVLEGFFCIGLAARQRRQCP